jgi:hypothetical protein
LKIKIKVQLCEFLQKCHRHSQPNPGPAS